MQIRRGDERHRETLMQVDSIHFNHRDTVLRPVMRTHNTHAYIGEDLVNNVWTVCLRR